LRTACDQKDGLTPVVHMGDEFSLQILEQGWLVPDEPQHDPCSHGRLRVMIGGREVLGGDQSCGISESALALLRTLDADHSPAHPVAQRMIFHGCGNILMMGCPIGLDFAVTHGGDVSLTDVVRYDTVNEDEAVHFPGLFVEIQFLDYRQEVLRFARQARELFLGLEKRFSDDFDTLQFREFWQEYESVFARHSR
jgi:hypothetical protein